VREKVSLRSLEHSWRCKNSIQIRWNQGAMEEHFNHRITRAAVRIQICNWSSTRHRHACKAEFIRKTRRLCPS